jgi:predicted 3-demethylubiquinone-9 3-methyltransferase (glyoxalase superfamily)
MVEKVTPFLMFEGKAEAALDLYVRLIPGAVVTRMAYYGPGGPGPEGQISQAAFSLGGRDFICMDSPVHHAFSFTPSVSLFLDCSDEAELVRLFDGLAEAGEVLMPLAGYGFSRRFGWVNDRFGVSWQLNLPAGDA